MPKAKMNKKQRLAAQRLENDEYYKTLGYKGGETLRGKYGRRIGVYDAPDLRTGLGDMPATSDVICGNGSKREAAKYTGTLVKGIATMHKSNAVPITSGEQAIEVSNMRR